MRLIKIEIDEDVWQALQALAEPLIDTPNTLLRRILKVQSSMREERAVSEQSEDAEAPVTTTTQPTGGSEVAMQEDGTADEQSEDEASPVSTITDPIRGSCQDDYPAWLRSWHTTPQRSYRFLQALGLVQNKSSNDQR
jgi:hypothetical protein